MDMGGIDNRFIYCNWSNDLALRFITERGGICLVAENCVINEENRGSYLRFKWSDHDTKTIDDFWQDGEVLSPKRKLPLQPFLDEGILDKTQGVKGDWE